MTRPKEKEKAPWPSQNDPWYDRSKQHRQTANVRSAVVEWAKANVAWEKSAKNNPDWSDY